MTDASRLYGSFCSHYIAHFNCMLCCRLWINLCFKCNCFGCKQLDRMTTLHLACIENELWLSMSTWKRALVAIPAPYAFQSLHLGEGFSGFFGFGFEYICDLLQQGQVL